jgi:hypothetical protein
MTSHRFLNRSVWLPLAAGSPSRPGALFVMPNIVAERDGPDTQRRTGVRGYPTPWSDRDPVMDISAGGRTTRTGSGGETGSLTSP